MRLRGGREAADARRGVEMNGGTDVLITGTVAIVRGCIGLNEGDRSFAVVWPRGTHYARNSGTTVQLPDGRTFALGDEFEGGGGWEHAESPLVPSALPAEFIDDRVAVLNEDQSP